ncbi:hypothetical protein DID78_02560 [Candidatus Marinamargulisbacteria bacterium SCGC AG-343-D04]|nr:hypothetical protein DID78_02560 [Candidatus Marinamargulisbacteria bacterium SCGC AG-343-D04]
MKHSKMNEVFSKILQQHQQRHLKYSHFSIKDHWYLKDHIDGFIPGYLKLFEYSPSLIEKAMCYYTMSYIPKIQQRFCQKILNPFKHHYKKRLPDSIPFTPILDSLETILSQHSHLIKLWTLADISSFLNHCIYTMLSLHKLPKDLYQEEKKIQNNYCIQLYPELRERLLNDSLPFDLLIYLVTKANCIDSSDEIHQQQIQVFLNDVGNYLDGNTDYKEILDSCNYFEDKALYYDCCGEQKCFLYECDNHGEIFFDCLLIEYLLRKGHTVVLSLKSSPVLNDVTFQDFSTLLKSPALQHFQDYLHNKSFHIINSGSNDVIKHLPFLSDDYKTWYHRSDCIISKGQGHFTSYPKCLLGLKNRSIRYQKPIFHSFILKSRYTQHELRSVHKKAFRISEPYAKYFS